MNQPLFRQEVIDANRSKAIGTIALYCPPYRWLIITLVAIVTIAIALFLFFGSYTKRETAAGELLPRAGVYSIVPPVGGTVVKLFAREGQLVKRGDPLLEISSEVSTTLGQTRGRISEQLALQRQHLLADLDSVHSMSKVVLEGLNQREVLLKAQIKQSSTLLQQRIKQVALTRHQLTKIRKMREAGYASNSQVEQQETALLEAEGRQQDAANQELVLQQQLAQVRQQILEQPLNARNQQHDIERKLADIEQSLAENESRRGIILRAPEDSIVGTVLTQLGQIVSGGQSVMSLLPPASSKLQARMMVSSRSIGFIQPGQRVVLRYQAFPYQKFGQQYGVVTDVSRTALSPQEVSTLTGNSNVQEKYYRVLVALDSQIINVYGKSEHLRPGIALEADFLIDNRRLIEWVLEPLYALGRRSAA